MNWWPSMAVLAAMLYAFYITGRQIYSVYRSLAQQIEALEAKIDAIRDRLPSVNTLD